MLHSNTKPSSMLMEIVVEDTSESNKITRLKEELKKTPLDPASNEASLLLHEVILKGFHEIFLFFITEISIDINLRSTTVNKRTPFANAARNDHISILKELMARGADTTSADANGQFPLHLAVEYPLTVKYLIDECKADVNQRTVDPYGSTPFQLAVLYNQLETVKTLLELKADHQLRNLKGATSLNYIKRKNQMEMFLFLIEKLNHHELQTSHGQNGVHLAAKFNLPEMLEYLVEEKKIDVNSKDHDGETAFHIGLRNKSIRVLEKLVELKADYQSPNKYGKYPIHIANSRKTLEYLVNVLGVDINQKSKKDGQTALSDSIEYYFPEEFQTLLELKADINITNNEGEYPLHTVARCGRTEMARILLNRKDVAVNQIFIGGTPGGTPLTQTIYRQHTKTARVLLDHKGSITIPNNASVEMRVFDLCTQNGKEKNEALVLWAMHDMNYQISLSMYIVEKKLTWLAMAIFDVGFFSKSVATWAKQTSPDQVALLSCIAAHCDAAEFEKTMDTKDDCPETVKSIIEKEEFKVLAESRGQFLQKKDVMYYEVLHVEEVAKMIQYILNTHRSIFLRLPTVLFDVVFDFVADQSLCKTKPSEVLQAMSVVTKQSVPCSLGSKHALFFKRLTTQALEKAEQKKIKENKVAR